jgi:undecaprenyl-diphosphatase
VFRSTTSIAIVSIVMALLLALSELVGSRRRQLDGVQPRDGLLVGFAQALALLPGVSRSGSTLTASLFDGWDRAAAARFSFLLGIPAITLAGLVEVKDALHESANGGLLPTLVGVIAAAVVSWLAIAWLLRFLQRNSTWIFVAYRLLFGLVLLVWFRDLGAAQP